MRLAEGRTPRSAQKSQIPGMVSDVHERPDDAVRPAAHGLLPRRLSRPGPRYTSYPTAAQFHAGFAVPDHEAALAASNLTGRPLALYVHIPFCEKLCYYCGCHMIVTHRPQKVSRYVEALEHEIDLVASRLDPARSVVQVHWGGGTPTILEPAEIERLMGHLRGSFGFAREVEASIEADPRNVTEKHLAAAARAGFDRLSLGVQTFDPVVQQAIGRVQPVEVVAAACGRARYEGFRGISFDLIYGLPHQSRRSFERTLREVVHLAPDRVAVFGYAHVPWMKKHQRVIDEAALPGPDQRLELADLARERLVASGYVPVGMDHFARPGDPLAVAQERGDLRRNFQGYATRGGDADVVGFGVSAISDLGKAYAQNARGLPAYYRAVASGVLPTERGVRLTDDDVLRRHVIHELMCSFRLDLASVEARFGVTFDSYFAGALDRLGELVELGLVEVGRDTIDVTEQGRPFVRNVAMAFDAYLEDDRPERRYSQTV